MSSLLGKRKRRPFARVTRAPLWHVREAAAELRVKEATATAAADALLAEEEAEKAAAGPSAGDNKSKGKKGKGKKGKR